MWIPALQKVPYSCTKFTETNTFNKLKSALSGESPSEHTLLEQGTGGAVQTWAAQHTGRQRERDCMAGRSFSITTLRPAIASVQRGRLLNKGATGRFSSHHCDWNPDTDNLIEQRLLGLTILEAYYCMVAGRAPTVVACSHGTEEETESRSWTQKSYGT